MDERADARLACANARLACAHARLACTCGVGHVCGREREAWPTTSPMARAPTPPDPASSCQWSQAKSRSHALPLITLGLRRTYKAQRGLRVVELAEAEGIEVEGRHRDRRQQSTLRKGASWTTRCDASHASRGTGIVSKSTSVSRDFFRGKWSEMELSLRAAGRRCRRCGVQGLSTSCTRRDSFALASSATSARVEPQPTWPTG